MFKWFTVEIESLDGTIVSKRRFRKENLVKFLYSEKQRLKDGAVEPMNILFHNGLSLLGNVSFNLCESTNVLAIANQNF